MIAKSKWVTFCPHDSCLDLLLHVNTASRKNLQIQAVLYHKTKSPIGEKILYKC